jgi:hypothetical protein
VIELRFGLPFIQEAVPYMGAESNTEYPLATQRKGSMNRAEGEPIGAILSWLGKGHAGLRTNQWTFLERGIGVPHEETAFVGINVPRCN